MACPISGVLIWRRRVLEVSKKHKLAVLVAFLSLVIPARLFAKGVITKITIEGANLKIPIEITDFRDFKGVGYSPWAGPGVWVNGRSADRRVHH